MGYGTSADSYLASRIQETDRTLNGEKPEGNELYQRAASALIALKSNNIMPLQLWEISYWLLDLGRSISIFVSKIWKNYLSFDGLLLPDIKNSLFNTTNLHS